MAVAVIVGLDATRVAETLRVVLIVAAAVGFEASSVPVTARVMEVCVTVAVIVGF